MRASQPRPIIGEIRAFAGAFAPAGWLICDGSIKEIKEYELLFQLIGNTYGGNRTSTFGIPDLRGRLIVQNGQLTGGANYRLGTRGGAESVNLTAANMASHQHSLAAGTIPATTNLPNGNFLAVPQDANNRDAKILAYLPYDAADTTLHKVPLHPNVLTPAGSGQPHENRQPFLCVTYIISTQGIFPTFQ